MELVAERASVSKMTVYANFSESTLLSAVFDQKSKRCACRTCPLGRT